ncbi:hypothetical protein AC579_2535 [Pseudocercospora musae]|uniref:Uncharacterized protein n=1 Tax=Pseudocercospora musae TaxID=113226 RepID=A0A139I087_9PEZI|nr:hypothetical protein AC579_2535 [Pseudocercospora musae]KXT08029.1 hypothetical protein AC579_2535 [Pseudocercospora musae]
MDFSDVFRIVNLVVGVLMILGGIGQFWPNINVHRCAWYRPSQSLPDDDDDPLTICAEFQIPPQVARYASFMFSFIGRGVCKRLRRGNEIFQKKGEANER